MTNYVCMSSLANITPVSIYIHELYGRKGSVVVNCQPVQLQMSLYMETPATKLYPCGLFNAHFDPEYKSVVIRFSYFMLTDF